MKRNGEQEQRAVLTVLVLAVAGALACSEGSGPGVASLAAPVPAAGAPRDWFTDEAAPSGLDFVHVNGATGRYFAPEIMGSGVGLLDYDNDGDLDVFFVQGARLGGPDAEPASRETGGRLFRNDSAIDAAGSRRLRFTDVTERSGIKTRGYGMGVAVGDIDNDGCADLYVTAVGRNQLFHNNCDGTFTDVSTSSGLEGEGWSVSATFFDYDRDGWLDLFVGHYLRYSVEADRPCTGASGSRDYCAPQVYRAEPSHLYRNNHDGTFTDRTTPAGLSSAFGPALGVVAADFDNDGWADLYVGNDGQENQLWRNRHDGTFENIALRAGVALTVDGRAEASMGVDAGDVDNDGDEDLVVAELNGEGTNLFVNEGEGQFQDRSAASGLGPASVAYTGFGSAWFDFDGDGRLDILTVNGMVRGVEERRGRPAPYAQRKLLLQNLGNGHFQDVSPQAGTAFQIEAVGRGAAFGDIDNDGDIDVVVSNVNGRAQLLVNHVGNQRHWIGVAVRTRPPSRDALGARVGVVLANGRVVWRRARADGSYASAQDPRVIVGLGGEQQVSAVRVRWPDGRSEEWGGQPVDRYATLIEGTGR